MIRILKEPKNAIVKQYKALFDMDGVKLEFEDDALEAVAEKTLEKKTGARGLRSIMESVLMESMFNVPGDKTIREVIITRDCVENNAKPRIIRTEKKSKKGA